MEKLNEDKDDPRLSSQLLAISSESEPFLPGYQSGLQRKEPRRSTAVAALSTAVCILAVVSSALGLALLHTTNRLKTAPTDFLPASNSVDFEQVLFTGSPAFTDNGTMFIEHPGDPIYTGKGSSAIDRAWDDLLFGRYFTITAAEAEAAFGSSYQDYYSPVHSAYVAGLDVFHTLHCVNQLRRAFEPDRYGEMEGPHRDHCLNQIRQYVMCAGDTTPVPTRYYPGLRDPHDSSVKGGDYVMSDVVHTCRNFAKLREWLTGRYKSSSVHWNS